MQRRITVLFVAIAGLCLVAASPAAAAKKRMSIVGDVVFNAGKGVTDNQRFAPRNVTVQKGDKVVLRNRAKTPDEHTLSIVRRRQLPDSFECAVCESIGIAHGFNPETGEVTKRRVDVGAEGFDQPGDSVVIAPKEKVSFRVTADEGKTLYFLCAAHPWMQGKFKVG